MMKLHNSLVALSLLTTAAACSGTGADAKDATIDDAAIDDATIAPSPICNAYLKCVAAATPQAFPAALATYKRDGPCWKSKATADTCVKACEQGLVDLILKYPKETECRPKSDAGVPDAGVSTNKIVKAVKAAFSAWEGIDCSGLKFEYKGTLKEIKGLIKEGSILVGFWSNDPYVGSAYHSQVNIESDDTAHITDALIYLNAEKFWWAIGKEKNKIYIQTAVMHMIPSAVGFYVGSEPATGNLKEWIKFDFIDRTLLPLHKMGARYSYFKSGASCTQPNKPVICGKTSTGGAIQLCIYHSSPNTPANGKPYRWPKMPIPYYVYVSDQGKLPK
jgi:hypothetical protein